MKQYLLLSLLALWQCFTAVAGTVSFSPSSVNWQANTHAEYGAGYLWSGVEGLEVGLYKATSAYSVTPGTDSYLKVRQNQVMEIATLQGRVFKNSHQNLLKKVSILSAFRLLIFNTFKVKIVL